jgi:hypothetical protein
MLIPAWPKVALIGAAVAILATAYGTQAWRISLLKRDNLVLAAAEKAASQAAAAWKRTTDAERTERQKEQRAALAREEANDANRTELALEAAGALAAAGSADRLRRAAQRAAAACRGPVPAHPTDAASGPPAGDAGLVFADVLARLERRGRELARLAGERGAAGAFCERERDPLTTPAGVAPSPGESTASP